MTRAALLSLLLAAPHLTFAQGLGRAPQPARTAAADEGPGTFDGKSYQLGFHLAPLLGYESNYKLTGTRAAGSALFALEAGVDFGYRPSPGLRLSTELSSLLRLPMSATGLTELFLELPALFFYRLRPGLELFLSQHLGLERGKAPPIFLEMDARVDPALTGGSIRYFAVSETLRPALSYTPTGYLLLEAGPYFRVKGVSFLENPYGGEADYRLLDLGFDVSGKIFYRDRFSARLKYDFARRFYPGFSALSAAHRPELASSLAASRHLIGIVLRARLLGLLGLFAGYSLRVNADNGGYFSYLEHMPRAGLSLTWRELVQASVGIGYYRRGYSRRTRCEALEFPEGSGQWVGSDCQPPATGEIPLPLERAEAALQIDLRATVTITQWLSALLTYEVEDASADLQDPMIANHRVMAGCTIDL